MVPAEPGTPRKPGSVGAVLEFELGFAMSETTLGSVYGCGALAKPVFTSV